MQLIKKEIFALIRLDQISFYNNYNYYIYNQVILKTSIAHFSTFSKNYLDNKSKLYNKIHTYLDKKNHYKCFTIRMREWGECIGLTKRQ